MAHGFPKSNKFDIPDQAKPGPNVELHNAKPTPPYKVKMPASEAEKIESHKANLPLPEDPPGPSDWQSFDARNTSVGVGSGRQPTGDRDYQSVLREPATAGSDSEEMHKIGREGKDNLPGPPKDAAYRR